MISRLSKALTQSSPMFQWVMGLSRILGPRDVPVCPYVSLLLLTNTAVISYMHFSFTELIKHQIFVCLIMWQTVFNKNLSVVSGL